MAAWFLTFKKPGTPDWAWKNWFYLNKMHMLTMLWYLSPILYVQYLYTQVLLNFLWNTTFIINNAK